MRTQPLDFQRQDADGKLIFLSPLPGMFASYYYLLGILVLLLLGQLMALWVFLVAGLFAHGYRYPRTYGVFYPLYFWVTALAVLLIPTTVLALTLPVLVAVPAP